MFYTLDWDCQLQLSKKRDCEGDTLFLTLQSITRMSRFGLASAYIAFLLNKLSFFILLEKCGIIHLKMQIRLLFQFFLASQNPLNPICCYFETRRIAEMKRRECQLAVEEVMYMLIVQSFSRINVPMVPNLSKCINNGRLDIWSSKDQELESIHGIELLEIVREHFSNILRLQGKSDTTGNWSTIKIQRLQLGRLYAASIMYGYFLKSVCLRHTLELSLSSSSEELFGDKMMCSSLQYFQKQEQENLVTLGCSLDNDASLHHTAHRGKAEKLKGYMMGFDSYTLRLCAKLRSDVAGNLIENHSWALFGNLESGSLDKDEVVAVPVSGLKRLILEAVAFGTFLWDVEWFVDSKYKLKDSEDQGSS